MHCLFSLLTCRNKLGDTDYYCCYPTPTFFILSVCQIFSHFLNRCSYS